MGTKWEQRFSVCDRVPNVKSPLFLLLLSLSACATNELSLGTPVGLLDQNLTVEGKYIEWPISELTSQDVTMKPSGVFARWEGRNEGAIAAVAEVSPAASWEWETQSKTLFNETHTVPAGKGEGSRLSVGLRNYFTEGLYAQGLLNLWPSVSITGQGRDEDIGEALTTTLGGGWKYGLGESIPMFIDINLGYELSLMKPEYVLQGETYNISPSGFVLNIGVGTSF